MFNGAVQNGAGCDADGSVCTVGDVCSGGTCKAGSALNCDDANACTTDGCSASKGCSHVANSQPCNDGNACTGPDVCSGGACKPALLNCDDGNPCTTDTCDATKGCVHAAVPDKTSCSSVALCLGGVCTAGSCGDGVVLAALGEQCDDHDLSGDGCSATCKKEDPACADGTRDGIMDAATYPKIALCSGPWLGDVGSGQAQALCGKTFHVCNGDDIAKTSALPKSQGMQSGCWAIDANNDIGKCGTCGDHPGAVKLAGIGAQCGNGGANQACMSSGWGVIAGNSCVRDAKNKQMEAIIGVVCCAN